MNSYPNLLGSKFQRGFGLVEVAVAVGIVAVAAAVLLQYIAKQVQGTAEIQSQDLLARAQKAVVAYAVLQGRLPCPASSTDGRETCNGASEGKFPFITVGLPEKDSGALVYRVGNNVSGLTAPSGVHVLLPEVTNQKSLDVSLPEIPQSLKDAAPLADIPSVLQVTTGSVAVAWKTLPLAQGRPLALCQMLAPKSALANLSFELRPDTNVPLASVLTNARYAVSNAQLFDHMRCEAHAVVASRAHANAYTATATFMQALADYRLERSYIMAMLAGDVVGLSYSVVNASWTLQRTYPKFGNAISEIMKSEGLTAVAMVKAINDIVVVSTDLVNILRHITNLTRMSILFGENIRMLGVLDGVMGEMANLQIGIYARMLQSADSGFLYTRVAQ